MREKLVVFSTRTMQGYAADVQRILKDSGYGQGDIQGHVSISRFADGEMEAEVETSVRGRDVFLFAGAARNSLGLSVEESKIEMYHVVDALRRAQAGRITLFEPYCSPARSDRLTRRNSVGLWVHFKTLVSLGIDHYITFQLHSEKSKTVVDPTLCDFDDIPAQALLQRYLCDHYVRTLENLVQSVRRDWAFCSVDAGGEALGKKFAASFGTKMIISLKQRDYSTPDTVESINILSSEPIEGKTVWIVDDMVSTGQSICMLAQQLERLHPAAVNLALVHPVFSDPSLERLGDLCARKLVRTIIVTDTVECGKEIKEKFPCLQVVPSVRLAADILQRLNHELPLSSLLTPFNAFEYLSGTTARSTGRPSS
jgi:ribose-phosphate pyrophosphokinase